MASRFQGAVADNRVGEQGEPSVDHPSGGEGESLGAVVSDDQLVEILWLGQNPAPRSTGTAGYFSHLRGSRRVERAQHTNVRPGFESAILLQFGNYT